MSDTSRIEELRRRVQRDPASIAFAQLAEEYRRAGRYKEAIETCEQGLAHHPGYLSARVTLGRSYLEINELDAAQVELNQVLRAAPENLAALRGMAEIHHRRGELQEALAHYRTALEFARNDPELQHLVEQIAKELEPQPAAPAVADGMSFEDVRNTFLNLSLPGDEIAAASDATPPALSSTETEPSIPTIDLTPASEDEPFPWSVHDDTAAVALEPPAPVALDTPVPVAVDTPLPVVLDTPLPVALETSRPVEDMASPPSDEEPVWQAAPAPPVAAAVASPEPAVAVEGTPVVEVAALALPSELPELADIALSSIESPQLSPDLHVDTLPVAPVEPFTADAAPATEPAVTSQEPLLAPAAVAASGEQADAAAQVDALERWLETIIADRQRRA